MKLKEIIAKDYAQTAFPDPTPDTWDEVVHSAYGDGFLAGFEKARSLAAKIAYDPSFDGTGDKIDCLGEEEV